MPGEAPSSDRVIDNAERRRFELAVEGGVAIADYQRQPGRIVITHVETPPALRGQGVAARLMKGVLELVRQEGLKVAPVCPYADVYIRRRPEYQDLVG